jgi:mRNA-degrading endonuclease YafQ of YafQ-DinJ toxin-antitoxin module
MRFSRTPQFREDFRRLSQDDKDNIREAFSLLSEALQGNGELYKKFRIKKMKGHKDIWEGHVKIDLCFTFQYRDTDNGEKDCFFRRIGTHKIYNQP